MRLIVIDGVQYDADNLPKGVDAKKGVPADEWFAQNRVTGEPDAKPKRRSAKAAKSGE